MNNADALKARFDYHNTGNPTEEDEFKYVEAMGYLIEKTKDPEYMCELGWYYASQKRFDLEFRYLDMAVECGSIPAMEELGYIWYYGQHGEQDYEKAFYYFSRGASEDDGNGSLWCKYKLADMYRYGCYVDKDEAKYRELIEETYEAVKTPMYLSEPFPEVALRLAGIKDEDGQKDEAVQLLRDAKKFMAERLSGEAFWGHIQVMGRIVRYLYQLVPFDEENADFYDLFYLTQKPGRFNMLYHGKKAAVDVTEENGELAIGFEGKWYRSFEDFCQKAVINGQKITSIYDEIYNVSSEEKEVAI